MTAVAVTGHMDLTERTVHLVRDALAELLRDLPDGPPVGISCLAPGADTVFADAVLACGGTLVAVIPSRDYRAAEVRPDHAADFDRLLTAADRTVVMPFDTAGTPAYDAANAELVERAELLVAVWDSSLPTGKGGGTADTVDAARRAGVPVRVVWPAGSARSSDTR
ncbi:hypothetical protein ACIQF6_23845 [Kitasatospora sp. NPDC092948]|uniref:hypothetical protein n=1 Tax=Kitasatospora sp. NPDC092948 TaxID=3364088 RepID=UPI00380EC403